MYNVLIVVFVFTSKSIFLIHSTKIKTTHAHTMVLHIDPPPLSILPFSQSDLCQGLEEVGLVSERVVDQAVTEGDNAMREVVLR